jgi:hypothetical protein
MKEKLSALNRAIFVQDANEAASLYGQILAEKSDFQLRGPVQYDLASLLHKHGHRELAYRAYTTIIEKQKDNKALPPSLKAAGILAFELQRFADCVTHLDEFLKTKPVSADRQEAEEILSRLPPEHRSAAGGGVKIDAVPQSQWSIGETPKPVTFEWKVESGKRESLPKKTAPPKVPTEPEVIALDGVSGDPPASPPPSPGPTPMVPYAPSPALAPPRRMPEPAKPARSAGVAARLASMPEPLPPTQVEPSQALPTEPEFVPQTGAMTPGGHPGMMPGSGHYYPVGAPPQGYYHPMAPPPQYAPPPGPPMTPYPQAYGLMHPAPQPMPGYPPPASHLMPPPPAAPPARPVVDAPQPLPNSSPHPPPADSPEARYERVRDSLFAILLPVGKRINLEAVAELVGRYEGVNEADAKKQLLHRKGVVYTDLDMDQLALLHPIVKRCRQELTVVAVPPALRDVECHTVTRAERRDQGIKMTTDGAIRRMRWSEIRLLNCGIVGSELIAVVAGGEPLREFRFKQFSFDASGFLINGASDMGAHVLEFWRLMAEKAPDAIRSHIVAGLLSGKFTTPQVFPTWEEWDFYCNWVLYSHFAEVVNIDELIEIHQVSSNW